MSLVIRNLTATDLESLRGLLDKEFIFNKGRRISLLQRFSGVYCVENGDNIFLTVDRGIILSALAVKRFTWSDQGNIFSAAMIGAVYTQKEYRKQGLAGKLISATIEKLKNSKLDFAVLWTSQPTFYATFGWLASDVGLLGEIAANVHEKKNFHFIATNQIDNTSLEIIEHIRTQHLSSHVTRRRKDYYQLPLPAESVGFLLSEDIGNPGYALVGRAGTTNILYEMAGHPASFPSLWQHMSCLGQTVLVNDQPGSASYHWLTENTPITWESKALASWYGLSDRVNSSKFSCWYIPYFDRI